MDEKIIKLKIALRREYNSKKFYWEAQGRKAKQYVKKYSLIVKDLEKEIKILERKIIKNQKNIKLWMKQASKVTKEENEKERKEEIK